MIPRLPHIAPFGPNGRWICVGPERDLPFVGFGNSASEAFSGYWRAKREYERLLAEYRPQNSAGRKGPALLRVR